MAYAADTNSPDSVVDLSIFAAKTDAESKEWCINSFDGITTYTTYPFTVERYGICNNIADNTIFLAKYGYVDAPSPYICNLKCMETKGCT